MPDFEMDLTAPKPIVHGIQRPHDGFRYRFTILHHCMGAIGDAPAVT
jgi:hypothetical protein